MASISTYMGSVEMWPVSWPIRNWALCNGALLPISDYNALFALIGTYYGGNGRTTFGVPNLKDRIPIGASGSLHCGQFGGASTSFISAANMPQHTHEASGTVKLGAMTGKGSYTNDPINNYAGNPDSSMPIYGGTANAEMGESDVIIDVQPAGGSQAFSNMPPYLGMNFIIALQGIFPPRN